jgi:hypothetical protein
VTPRQGTKELPQSTPTRYFKAVGMQMESFWSPELRYPPPGHRVYAPTQLAERQSGNGHGFLWAHTNLEELLPGRVGFAENRWPLRFLELAEPEGLVTDERHGVGAQSWLVAREVPRYCLFGRRGRIIAGMLDRLTFLTPGGDRRGAAPGEVLDQLADGLRRHSVSPADFADAVPALLSGTAARSDDEQAKIAERVTDQAYRVAAISAAEALNTADPGVRRRVVHGAALAWRCAGRRLHRKLRV